MRERELVHTILFWMKSPLPCSFLPSFSSFFYCYIYLFLVYTSILDLTCYNQFSCQESKNNFCSLATGTSEERRIWTYQSRKLISVCLFILVHFDKLQAKEQKIIVTTSLAMRLVVVFTDYNGWKNVNENNRFDTEAALKDLVHYLGTSESGLYLSVRKYMCKLSVIQSSRTTSTIQTNDLFVITVSAITLALRPFRLMNFDAIGTTSWEGHHVAEQFCLFLLTIPELVQNLPQVLVPAVKHRSILLPCFWTLLVRAIEVEQIFYGFHFSLSPLKLNSSLSACL